VSSNFDEWLEEELDKGFAAVSSRPVPSEPRLSSNGPEKPDVDRILRRHQIENPGVNVRGSTDHGWRHRCRGGRDWH
jgi:hypothetical protein